MDKSGASGGTTERNYNEPVTTRQAIACNCDYIRTIPGILKLVETGLSVAALICGLISLGAPGGWGAFVAGSSLATCIVVLLLHLTGLGARTPFSSTLAEFIMDIIFAVFFLIAGIVCAVFGAYAPYGAYAFFGLAACVTYVVDVALQFRGGLSFTWSSRQQQQPAAQQRQEPERY